MADPAAVQFKAAELGKLAVRMTALAGSGHPSSALSLAHIVAELLYVQMRHDPSNPWHPTADRLVLSEGHAVPIIYAAWADLGGAVGKSPDNARALTPADVDTLRERESVLDGHPNPAEGFPFFDAATGSLGQGLSVAGGLAAAARLDGSERRVYAIVGDGESREGQIWEACDFIVDYGLNNVCAFFNANAHGQAAPVSAQQSADSLVKKLTAFGWEVISIDGHNPQEIADALSKFGKNKAPLAIVAKTVKGWGVDELLKGNWHGKPLKPNELDAAYASLDRAVGGKSGLKLGPPPAAPAPERKIARNDPKEAEWPSFEDAMASVGLKDALDKGKLATRRAYGAALKAAGDVLPQVVALDGDVCNSTFSDMFAKAHPKRFFECKIAEQNMISVAAGLSAAGLIPFASTFAKFLSRAYDQVELANLSRANIKLVGSHAGITPSGDGPSQMSLPDVAYFRSFTTVRGDDRKNPLCWVYQPADAVAAYHCTRLMIEFHGLCYMRTHRPDVPLLYKPDAAFEPGGVNVLSPGTDIALVSSGYMVHVAKAAVELLAKQNIRAALVDAYSLPINEERLADALQRTGGNALVIEDNYGGGFGSAVAEFAARTGAARVETCICQRLPKSTREIDEILDLCGVSAPQIADHALAMIKRSAQ